MTESLQVLAPDARAVALLCAEIPNAQSGSASDTDAQPLTPAAYHAVAYHLHTTDHRPSDLLDLSAEALADLLPESVDADRVAALLGRSAALDAMLSVWQARGGWMLTRSDAAYPDRLRRRLRHDAPPLLFGLGPVDALDDGGATLLVSRNAPDEARAMLPHVADAARRDDVRLFLSAPTAEALPADVSDSGPALVAAVDTLPGAPLHEDTLPEDTLPEDGNAAETFVSTAPPGHTSSREASTRLACALGDAVIVGHAGSRGVTWNAVVEVLHRDRVPVVVRTPAFTSPGHRKLLARGARPIDERGLQAGASLRAWLFGASASAAPADSDAAPNLSIVPSVPSAEHVRAFFATHAGTADTPALFPLVWPILQPLLASPRSERDVQDAFADATLGQIRDWLHHATRAGLVTRTERPVRYALAEPLVEG